MALRGEINRSTVMLRAATRSLAAGSPSRRRCARDSRPPGDDDDVALVGGLDERLEANVEIGHSQDIITPQA
jgi:hypothetical protein